MKILTGNQIKDADRYTIGHEPIDSLDLMERASEAIAQWIASHIEPEDELLFFIGKGNNGGDGLAAARMLSNAGFRCTACLLYGEDLLSEECRLNLHRLPEDVCITEFGRLNLENGPVIVDAVLGSGVKGELDGYPAAVIGYINASSCRVISIDLPSGMRTEFGNVPETIVHAGTTLTLEFPKLAMLLPEAGECCGDIVVLPIDLDPGFMENAASDYYYVEENTIRNLVRPRSKFAHKNTYGHALLVCGSRGMAGASILATSAALRSGCGLVTTHLPESERFALQANTPSGMTSLDPGACFSVLPENVERYSAVGVGPGLRQAPETVRAFGQLLEAYSRPMVIDADALNILAAHPESNPQIPAGSILTPHVGELRRLTGGWESESEKIQRVRALAGGLKSIVIVKGAHTMTCLPDGRCFFNSTGNAGMAKGGSGDVLTGFLTGLLARGYTPAAAALTGVYVHGLAGDKAAAYYGEEGMNGGDLAEFLAEALTDIQ